MEEIIEAIRMSTLGYAGLDVSYATALANARKEQMAQYQAAFGMEQSELDKLELAKELEWAKNRLEKK